MAVYLIAIIIVSIICYVIIAGYINKIRLKKALLSLDMDKPDFDIENIKYVRKYWDIKYKYEKPKYVIDDTTWDDLDMDLIYSEMNYCKSSVGSEYLYSLLRETNFDVDDLDEFDSLINFLEENEKTRVETLYALNSLGISLFNYTHKFIFESQNQTLQHKNLYAILGKIPIICLIGYFFHPMSLALCFISCAVNMFIYYRHKYKFEVSLNSIRYISKIIGCANTISKLDFGSLKYSKDLKKNAEPLKKLTSLGNSLANKSNSEIDMFSEYIKTITMWDFINYNKIISLLVNYKEEFYKIFLMIGRLDAALSILFYRRTLPLYSKPIFKDVNEVIVHDVYHPLITEPIVNSIIFNHNSLITGSNASGKSTFIKALAVNIICSQTINLCFAKEYISNLSYVITSMAVKDSIVKNESYFVAEIKSLKRVLDTINNEVRCICFIDEILKGTNTIERISASSTILHWLSKRNCLVMVASHDIELTEILHGSFKNYHFREQVNESGLVFDHKIYEGAAMTRNAINLLKFMEFSPAIVTSATELASSFEKSRKWVCLND